MKFRVGQRVVCNRDFEKRSGRLVNHTFAGKYGRILVIEDRNIGVEMDESFQGGHSCYGRGKHGYCWNFFKEIYGGGYKTFFSIPKDSHRKEPLRFGYGVEVLNKRKGRGRIASHTKASDRQWLVEYYDWDKGHDGQGRSEFEVKKPNHYWWEYEMDMEVVTEATLVSDSKIYKKGESEMNKIIAGIYLKTENAVVVDKYFGNAVGSNYLMGLVVKGNKQTVLDEARALKAAEEKAKS